MVDDVIGLDAVALHRRRERSVLTTEGLRRQPPAAAPSHYCYDIWQMRQRSGGDTHSSSAAVVHISQQRR